AVRSAAWPRPRYARGRAGDGARAGASAVQHAKPHRGLGLGRLATGARALFPGTLGPLGVHRTREHGRSGRGAAGWKLSHRVLRRRHLLLHRVGLVPATAGTEPRRAAHLREYARAVTSLIG